MFAAIGLATLVALDLVLGWSGERPSMVLAILVVTAECVVLAIGLWWRRRELTRLAQERLAISELCQALSGATG
ncbi:MAG: peptidoglycan biosynthesis protein MviN/MurJ (putative lipid II flippase) [Myxococcota bacterium]|jgi:peptidoglycan biosynthesis protein MviN/MurJ (putative lipid II flippase)